MGSGDGRGPYRWARRDPGRLFIAADANADGLRATASRAGRKPARGGLSNLLCVAEPLELLAVGLGPAADRLTVILPWGDLLRSIAGPSVEGLHALRVLCLPEARVEVVCSYDTDRDGGKAGPLGSTGLDAAHVRDRLPPLYESADLRIQSIETIDADQLARYETTWSKRLAFGRRRVVWRLRAVAG